MVVFFNAFLTYLILALGSLILIVVAIILGKKLREIKDAKDASKSEQADGE